MGSYLGIRNNAVPHHNFASGFFINNSSGTIGGSAQTGASIFPFWVIALNPWQDCGEDGISAAFSPYVYQITIAYRLCPI
jgi:hypothetical protein